MTFHYFTSYSTLNGSKQQQVTKKVDYELLDNMLETIKVGVEGQKSNFSKYVKAATKQGLKPKEIWSLAKERLRDNVLIKTLYNWGHELLPQEAFDFAQSQRRLLTKNTNVDVNLQPI